MPIFALSKCGRFERAGTVEFVVTMTIDDIKALIASDESRTLELKKTTGELKDGMHAACAFLNTVTDGFNFQ